MIEEIDTGSEMVAGFKLKGKLHDQDYKHFVPALEAALGRAGKLRLFVLFEDFHGWDLHAAWDDMVFGVKHHADFERIAMVGDKKWQEWMAKLCKPFVKADVRYFEANEEDAAWTWLREGTT